MIFFLELWYKNMSSKSELLEEINYIPPLQEIPPPVMPSVTSPVVVITTSAPPDTSTIVPSFTSPLFADILTASNEIATRDKVHVYASLNNPTFTGTVTLDAVSITSNNNTAATTSFCKQVVDEKIAEIVDTAPRTLDTLNELATALNNDDNFSATVATA